MKHLHNVSACYKNVLSLPFSFLFFLIQFCAAADTVASLISEHLN